MNSDNPTPSTNLFEMNDPAFEKARKQLTELLNHGWRIHGPHFEKRYNEWYAVAHHDKNHHFWKFSDRSSNDVIDQIYREVFSQKP